MTRSSFMISRTAALVLALSNTDERPPTTCFPERWAQITFVQCGPVGERRHRDLTLAADTGPLPAVPPHPSPRSARSRPRGRHTSSTPGAGAIRGLGSRRHTGAPVPPGPGFARCRQSWHQTIKQAWTAAVSLVGRGGVSQCGVILDFDKIVRPLQPLPPQRVLIGWVYRNRHGGTRPSREQLSLGTARFWLQLVTRFHKIDCNRSAVRIQNGRPDEDHSVKRRWVTNLSGAFAVA